MILARGTKIHPHATRYGQKKKKGRKVPNILKLNNTLLNISWVKDEIKREFRRCFELKIQHIKMCVTWFKAAIRGKFIPLNIY